MQKAHLNVENGKVKELMGHSDISTTMRYVHPTPKHRQEAARKLEQYNQDQVFARYESSLGPRKSPPTVRHQRRSGGVYLVESMARLGR